MAYGNQAGAVKSPYPPVKSPGQNQNPGGDPYAPVDPNAYGQGQATGNYGLTQAAPTAQGQGDTSRSNPYVPAGPASVDVPIAKPDAPYYYGPPATSPMGKYPGGTWPNDGPAAITNAPMGAVDPRLMQRQALLSLITKG